MKNTRCFFCYIFLLLLSNLSEAADHGSPLHPPELWVEEARLSGLFAFPDEKTKSLVLILTFFKKVEVKEEQEFDKVEYGIYMDLTSKVSYENLSEVSQYGGTVIEPKKIKEDVSIKFKLDSNRKLKDYKISGLKSQKGVKTWMGLRDDPFNFPLARGKNTMAFVVSIPFKNFPKNQEDWLIWANSMYGDTHIHQADHVARALRTSPVRLQKLNFLHPNLHVDWIKTQPEWSYPDQPEGIRPYEYTPDVMFFTTRRPAGYPNGRLLEDDVVKAVCLQGGVCRVYELELLFGDIPRNTNRDEVFLKDFPYLAEPN